MHLDLKHLQKIEAATLNVTLFTLIRMAEGLDTPLTDLLAAIGGSDGARATPGIGPSTTDSALVAPNPTSDRRTAGQGPTDGVELYVLLQSVGDVISSARQAKGLTQSELAAATATDIRVLQRIEAGRFVGVSLKAIVGIANVLQISRQALFAPRSSRVRRPGRPMRDTPAS